MIRIRFLKILGVVLGLLAFLVIVEMNLGEVRVTSTSVAIPLCITRDGQEVKPGEIRSVQYSFDVAPPKSLEEMAAADGKRRRALRNVSAEQGYCAIAASFSIVRIGGIFSCFTTPKVEPEYRSVFLRIAFADGRTVSLNFPVLSDRRQNVPMYIDVGNAAH